MTWSSVLLLGAGVALGLQFGIAGTSRLARPALALQAVRSYELLSPAVARAVALPLATLEVLVAPTIAWPEGRVFAAPVVLALLLVYTVAVAMMLRRGRAGADCGCGGLVGGIPIGPGLLVRNMAMCALALACTVLKAPPPQLPAQWVVGTLIGVGGWSLLLVIDLMLARERVLADD